MPVPTVVDDYPFAGGTFVAEDIPGWVHPNPTPPRPPGHPFVAPPVIGPNGPTLDVSTVLPSTPAPQGPSGADQTLGFILGPDMNEMSDEYWRRQAAAEAASNSPGSSPSSSSSSSSGSGSSGGAAAAPEDPLQQIKDLFAQQLEDRLSAIQDQYKPLIRGLRRNAQQARRDVRGAGQQARRGMRRQNRRSREQTAEFNAEQDERREEIAARMPEGADTSDLARVQQLGADRLAAIQSMGRAQARADMRRSRMIQQSGRNTVATTRQGLLDQLRTERATARAAARDAYNDQMIQLQLGQITGGAVSGGGGGGGGYRSYGGSGSSGSDGPFDEDDIAVATMMSLDPNSPYYGLPVPTILAHNAMGGVAALRPDTPSDFNIAQGVVQSWVNQGFIEPEEASGWANLIANSPELFNPEELIGPRPPSTSGHGFGGVIAEVAGQVSHDIASDQLETSVHGIFG